jgi:hypothetical protein
MRRSYKAFCAEAARPQAGQADQVQAWRPEGARCDRDGAGDSGAGRARPSAIHDEHGRQAILTSATATTKRGKEKPALVLTPVRD